MSESTASAIVWQALFQSLTPRSRSDWNDRLTYWERPASDSEEVQINRAANMVRDNLSENDWLNDAGVRIFAQGSYYNNTNVRQEADMDLRAVHPDIRVEYAPDVVVEYAQNQLCLSDTGRTFAEVVQGMRREITSELSTKFGPLNVDASGNKAIRLKKQPGSRADVDVVPTFQYYWVTWNSFTRSYYVTEGVTILGKNGLWTNNFPEQHHTNGIEKRARTKQRFKKYVRIFKRLRDELVESGQLASKQVPSFLVECLTYAVEDVYFLVEEDDRYDRAHRILARMEGLLNNTSWVSTATEINAVKFLFHRAQPWTIEDAKAFVWAARQRLEF